MQRTVFSLEIVREVLKEIENNKITQTREIASHALDQVNVILFKQIKGIAACDYLLKTIDEEE